MSKKTTWANLGFEEKLWQAADKMRNNMDPAEYKHVILWLLFLKYISDSFEDQYNKLKNDPDWLADPEHKDEYVADNIFWVPKGARWNYLKDNAKRPEIGKIVDDAMIDIEKDNATLKWVLPKNYARPDLDKTKLWEVIDLISTIWLWWAEQKAQDTLWRVYEYFLWRFASAEWKGWGEFYTPQCIVKTLVAMLEPYKWRVFDPCCGSWWMFVQSENFIDAHWWNKNDLSIYWQESNPTTWRLCRMNLAIRWISANLWSQNADTFHNDQHKDLKADFILANPPFNISDWWGDRLKEDVRWKYWVPPPWNANYAWIQHFIHHLSPTGIAWFVLANWSMSSNTSWEWDIRKKLIDEWLVDCIVAMPWQLFYSTAIPVCLWFVSRDRFDHKFRNRTDEILFIDARKMWTMVTRKNRELTDDDVDKISDTYHNWRNVDWNYEDIKWYCKAAKIEEVVKHWYVLTPWRYVGFEVEEEDNEVFEEKMKRLTWELSVQFKESKELEDRIKTNLKSIWYDI